jgi:hypothetical protein
MVEVDVVDYGLAAGDEDEVGDRARVELGVTVGCKVVLGTWLGLCMWTCFFASREGDVWAGRLLACRRQLWLWPIMTCTTHVLQ